MFLILTSDGSSALLPSSAPAAHLLSVFRDMYFLIIGFLLILETY